MGRFRCIISHYTASRGYGDEDDDDKGEGSNMPALVMCWIELEVVMVG